MLEIDVDIPRRHFVVTVCFAVAAGERFALFGPSGAGKSTILESVAGLLRPERGLIRLAGQVLWRGAGRHGSRPESVPVWDRAVALLRQEPSLFPHLSVRRNLTYSRRRSATVDVDGLVALLSLEGLLDARPAALSGGQAHRVALARALASDCRALLLDEPYTGLDAGLRRQVTALVRSEVCRRQLPSVLVTHDLSEAQAFADRVGVIDRGKLLQLGTPHEVVVRPASRRVAELVGYEGFVDCDGAVIGVHPERVLAGAHPGLGPVLTGRVLQSRPAGAGFEADLDVAGSRLTYRLEHDAGPPGARAEVTVVDPPRFGPDGDAHPDDGRWSHAPKRSGALGQ